jgi:hypothetical protein
MVRITEDFLGRLANGIQVGFVFSVKLVFWRHDTLYDDTQHDDTQHIRSIATLSIKLMLYRVLPFYSYDDC